MKIDEKDGSVSQTCLPFLGGEQKAHSMMLGAFWSMRVYPDFSRRNSSDFEARGSALKLESRCS